MNQYKITYSDETPEMTTTTATATATATTNQTSAEQAIQDQLRRLKWMIPDAMRRMDEAAQCMLRRAQGAVKATEALLADLRAAREAKAELAKLLEQQKLLEFFLRKDTFSVLQMQL